MAAELAYLQDRLRECSKSGPESIPDELADGISEFVAKHADQAVLDKVFPYAEVGGDYSLVDDAKLMGQLLDELHAALIGGPAEEIISDLSIPAADPAISIINAMPIKIIDHPLGEIKRWMEISGFCISIMCGHLPAALACLKALAHDEIHKAVASGVKYLITGGPPGEAGREEPLPSIGSGEPAPVTTSHAGDHVAREHRPVTTQYTAPTPEPTACPGVVQEETGQKPAAPAISSRPSPVRDPDGADVTPGSRPRKPPTAAGTPASPPPTEDQASTKRPAVPGKASTGPGGLRGAGGSLNAASSRQGGATTPVTPQLSPPSSAAVPAEARCVRLRIHYERADTAAHVPPAPPVTLIVEQEVSTLPACRAGGRAEAAGNAVSAAHGAKTGMTCQRWRAADDSGFADGSPEADALRRRLRSILTGAAVDDDPAMNVKDWPDGPGSLLAAPCGCVEIMGTITSRSGKNTLESIGIKTEKRTLYDGFVRIVVSAVSGLIPGR
ncbi:MAG: hypothetical protein ABSF03_28360 [Streptosporangiaceae bacterium]|jgi:hypothetical protein